MKIIIIGAGIGGLATYLSFKKHLAATVPSLTIKVYESHGSPSSTNSNIGGGLGLAPNGLRALGAVSQKAVAYIQERGYPASTFTIRNSSGRLLGNFSAGRPERYGGLGQTMLRRAVVHSALLEEIPDDVVVWGKQVSSVRETEAGVTVEFVDGLEEMADLVVGADGVRSVVRESIFGNKYPATYDGLTGVGGFIPLSRLPSRLLQSLDNEGVNMTFGSHGFFGYSLISSKSKTANVYSDPRLQWWSIYESSEPHSRSLPHATVRDQLLERHASWKSPYDDEDVRIYERIINLSCGGSSDGEQSNETLLILPRYLTPRLPRWTTPSGTGKIILLGDAAHAMPPDSGQGVSCAAEDAVVIGLLLKHYLVSQNLSVSDSVTKVAKAFEDVRMKRVWKILDVAKKRGDGKKKLGWWAEMLRDWFMWGFSKLPESINDGQYGYDAEAEVEKYLRKNT